jgi:predicted nucleotidyltransferase
MIFFSMFDPRTNEVRALCRRYGVRRLELFGSLLAETATLLKTPPR